jgi:hypothetical protein
MAETYLGEILEWFDGGRKWSGFGPGDGRTTACILTAPHRLKSDIKAISDVIREQYQRGGLSYHLTISTWNDDLATDWPDVEHVLEKAYLRRLEAVE